MTRIYLVVWTLVAIVGIWFAVEATKDKLVTRSALDEFLGRHNLSLHEILSRSPDSLTVMLVRNPDHFYLGLTAKGRFPGAYDDLSYDEVASRLIRNYPHVGTTLTRDQVMDSVATRREGMTEAEAFAALRHEGYLTADFPDTLPAVAVFFASAKDELSNAMALAQSDEVQHPFKVFGTIWGMWALLCLAVPATLFVTSRWIAAGFAKN